MQTFTTTQDVITAIVAPALGEHGADFDQEAIAQAITRWENGRLVLDEDADFWAIAEANEIFQVEMRNGVTENDTIVILDGEGAELDAVGGLDHEDADEWMKLATDSLAHWGWEIVELHRGGVDDGFPSKVKRTA